MALLGLAAGLALPTANATTYAVLSQHDATKWSNTTCQTTGTVEYIRCNLEVYKQAAAVASANGASMLVYPEGYGLVGSSSKKNFYELMVSSNGSVPCDSATASSAPQQVALSCAARANKIALVANIFVTRADGKRVINDVVFDSTGAVVTSYSKHHLFPTELLTFTAGPFQPASFPLLGRRFGLVICYEGVYPDVSGDWSQMEALVAQGADTFIWSVGGETPLKVQGPVMEGRFKVSMLASEDETHAFIGGPDGKAVASTDVPVAVPGYTAAATVTLAPLPPPASR